jgi:glycosyltransferase involved in cell wall biosynthesis
MKRSTLVAVGMLPPPFGGQALMFKRAVDALGQDYDLTVIDIQFQKNLGESGVLSAKKVMHLCSLLARKIIPLVLRTKIDILYYCLSGPSTIGLIKDLIFIGLLRFRARKTVYHIHGAGGLTLLMRSNYLLRAWARIVLFEPDLILRPASDVAEGHLCKAKAEMVIYNSIEDPNMLPRKLSRISTDAELSFTFIGLITEDKGVFDLVEVARQLRNGGHRFKLYVVGEGLPIEVARLRQLISQYDLTEWVQLTGVLIGEQKFKLLRDTTVFLFPSYFRAETQPTVIMEALAVGTPAVAYDWRGINTIVDQGVNGYLVPVRDTHAFYQAIEKILKTGNIDCMRRAARRIFLERFTLDRHVGKLREAFRSIDDQG